VVVVTTSTLNRIMVVELAFPALLPGALVAWHYAVQMVRPRMGYGADKGQRSTPWMMGGMLVLGLGGVMAALAAAPFAPLLSRYRGIFFAMLTLALSMVTYGLLMKLEVLGGSDGFNLGRPTLLGQKLPDEQVGYIMYVLTVAVSTVMALLARIYFDSTRGLITVAAKDNELRVEYLGGSVRQAMAINFVLAAFCGGLGGALAVMALGHIEPNFSFWTTSGEFVFVAILGGWQSVIALFVASTVLEVVRSFSSAYFPNTWQMALGIFLLIVIRFLPRGIGSLWVKGGTR
jgi:branched-chain amino acid transport system permease protein